MYVSSVHAIPERKEKGVTGETQRFSPAYVTGGYAKTKAAATRIVLQAAKRGLDVVVVHPSGVLGPYDRSGNHLVQMVAEYLNGTLPACVKGGYDFVDVRDVAQGCLLAAEKGRSGECYILSDRYCEIREVLAIAGAAAGKRCFRCCRSGWRKWRLRLYSSMPEGKRDVRCIRLIRSMYWEAGKGFPIKRLQMN